MCNSFNKRQQRLKARSRASKNKPAQKHRRDMIRSVLLRLAQDVAIQVVQRIVQDYYALPMATLSTSD